MDKKGFIKIVCDNGEIKITEFYNSIDSCDFEEILIDFVFNHIGNSFIFENFSPCRLSFSYRYNTEEFYFESLEELKNWYLFEI